MKIIRALCCIPLIVFYILLRCLAVSHGGYDSFVPFFRLMFSSLGVIVSAFVLVALWVHDTRKNNKTVIDILLLILHIPAILIAVLLFISFVQGL